MGNYSIEQRAEEWFVLLRNGEPVLNTITRDLAEGSLDEIRDQEAEAREALATGDPLAPCRLGWHRGPMPKPIVKPLGALGSYFTFCARIGEAGGTLVYRVAEGPFRYAARTVKTLGSVQPWFCDACEKHIGPDTA